MSDSFAGEIGALGEGEMDGECGQRTGRGCPGYWRRIKSPTRNLKRPKKPAKFSNKLQAPAAQAIGGHDVKT